MTQASSHSATPPRIPRWLWLVGGVLLLLIVDTLLGSKGNILIIRGVKGSAPDQMMYEGQMETLKQFPEAKIVGEVYGQLSHRARRR